MKRSSGADHQEAERGLRNWQRLVWGWAPPPPRQSRAQSLYPKHHSSVQQSEVRRDPSARPNIARALYPNLKER